MRPSVSVLIKTILCVIGLFMYCEYFIYYVILKDVSNILLIEVM